MSSKIIEASAFAKKSKNDIVMMQSILDEIGLLVYGKKMTTGPNGVLGLHANKVSMGDVKKVEVYLPKSLEGQRAAERNGGKETAFRLDGKVIEWNHISVKLAYMYNILRHSNLEFVVKYV